VSSNRPKGSKAPGGLKDNLTFRRLCSELDKLAPERRAKFMNDFLTRQEKETGKTVMLRPDQVAQILGLPGSTIRRWLREGKIKGVKMGRLWLIHKDEMNRILEESKG
jgi:excisionase family DNA binding protein